MRTHVNQLDKFNSSLLLARGSGKVREKVPPTEVIFTSQKPTSMRMGSSDLCSTLLQLLLAMLFETILAQSMSIIRTPHPFVFPGTESLHGVGGLSEMKLKEATPEGYGESEG